MDKAIVLALIGFLAVAALMVLVVVLLS